MGMDVPLPPTPVCTSRLKRTLFLVAGSVSLAVGVVGVVVPVLPTTPFLILTAICYSRGSSRGYRWLVTNRLFGRYLNDYLCGRGVSWKAKAGALVLLWGVIAATAVLFTELLWLRILLPAIAVAVTVHVLTLKTRGRDVRE
jgi:uncharacterized membrane protein YbaN (DUF454 family)